MNIFTQKLTLSMTWPEFITKIEKGLFGERYSDAELADKIGSSREVIFKIKIGKSQEPRSVTIGKIEKAFEIKIDDHDPENLTYKLISEVKEPIPGYGVSELTKEDLELLSKLKEIGIDSVEKLEKFYNLEGLAEDIKEILKKRILPEKK